MKKLAIVFGGLVGLLLLAALIIPLVFDVDKYRPMLVQKANEHINGKLELGKLSLSLWGQVKVDVDGLKLFDSQNRSVVKVKDASFLLPLTSLLKAKPEVRLKLSSPRISVLKQKDGKLNVSNLVKATAAEKTQSEKQADSSQSTSVVKTEKKTTEIPALVLAAHFTFLLEHAEVSYKDDLTQDSYKIKDLNFRLEDVSPFSNMPFELTAELDVQTQKQIKVVGPLNLTGEIKPVLENGAVNNADVKLALRMNDVEIKYADLFYKKTGVPFGADAQMNVGKDSVSVSSLKLIFASVKIDAQASAKDFATEPRFNFKAQSNSIDLGIVSDFSPIAKAYNPSGFLDLAVSAGGPLDRIEYAADVKFGKIQLSHESLKQSVTLAGSISVLTDQIKKMLLTLNAKDFDLSVSGALQKFASPVFRFSVKSNQMDLDGLLKASEKAAQSRKQQAKQIAQGGAAADSAAKQQVVDYNAMLQPLREIPILAKTAGTLDFSLKNVKTTGVQMQNIRGQFTLNNLLLALKDFSMGIFDGAVKASASFNAKPAKPQVGAQVSITGIQTQRMLESQMPFMRNTARGVIHANMNIGGPGLNPDEVMMKWRGGGNFGMKNAVFTAVDIVKQVQEGLTKLPPQVRDRIKADKLANRRGEYQSLDVKFGLAEGVFSVIDLTGKAVPNQGFDLKGNGTLRFPAYGLDMNLDIIDTYRLTNGEQWAKDPKYNKFVLYVPLKGTMFSPKFDWGAAGNRLVQNVLRSEGGRRAKEAIQKALKGKVPPEQLNKVLNKVGGGGNNPQPSAPAAPKPKEAVKALKGLFGR